jgi:hypothetical protein
MLDAGTYDTHGEAAVGTQQHNHCGRVAHACGWLRGLRPGKRVGPTLLERDPVTSLRHAAVAWGTSSLDLSNVSYYISDAA